MRIVLLTQVVPNPPDAGPRVKTHFVLRALAAEHDVDLVTFVRDEKEEQAARELEPICHSVTTIPLQRKRYLEPWYVLRGWSRLTPFLVARDYRRSFQDAVERHLDAGNVDVIHADQLSMAQYLEPAYGSPVHAVFDAHNAVWMLVRGMAGRQKTIFHRLAARVEWRLLRRYEQQLVRSASFTLTVGQQDLEALAPEDEARQHMTVIPIGVEVRDVEPVAFKPSARRLLSVATMHYPPNIEAIAWFRDAIWPIVQGLGVDVDVDVVGSRPPAHIVDWGVTDPRVTVHGYVPDVDDLYAGAAIFIVPLQSGSGVRVKVLEAMARGVCVVSTSIGIEGLDLTHREHLLVADSPTEFADAIRELMDSPELRRSLACAARERVLAHYDWRVCCADVLEVYRRLKCEADCDDVANAVDITPPASSPAEIPAGTGT